MVISQSKRAEMYKCGCLNDTNVEAIRSPKHTHEQTNKQTKMEEDKAKKRHCMTRNFQGTKFF